MKRELFFRKRILLSTLLPVLAIGIILSVVFVSFLTPPLFSFIRERTESELRLASGLGLEICEKQMNYLMELRLENDSEMVASLKNGAMEEIKSVSGKFHKVNLMITEENLDTLGSSIELPKEKLRLQTLPKNEADIILQEMGGERVRTYSLYFPLWRWHIVSFMYEKDYLMPVYMAKKLIYLGTSGVFIVVVITLFLVFNMMVTLPLKRIIHATEDVAGGRLEKIEVKRHDEIGQVSIAFNAMVESIDNIMSELKESESKFRSFAEQSFVGINIIQDGVFKYVNPKFTEIYGYTVEECINNMSFRDLIYPDDLAKVEENMRRRLSGEDKFIQYEIRGIKKTGEIIEVEIFGSSILLNGKPATTGIISDITERKRMENEMRELSLRNQLTGLYNRRGFIALAEQQLKTANRTKKQMLLAFIDIDDMKTINDTWGHEEGDRALKNVSVILKQAFRESDIIARIGGDEFAVLAIDAAETPETVMGRLADRTGDHNSLPDQPYKISMSIGTAIYDPESQCSLDELMSRADQLMYEQKRKKQP